MHPILQDMETIYDAMKKADYNNEKMFVWFSDIPHPFFNAVLHLSCDNVDQTIEEIMIQVPNGNPISFWLHPYNQTKDYSKALRKKNFQPVITCPLMYWNVQSTPEAKGDIRTVTDKDPFFQIVFSVYGIDEMVKEEYTRLMEAVPCENYLVYERGKAVSAATILIHGEIGAIVNDATLPGKRECSANLVRFLKQRAHELNLKKLILLSSPEGEELYHEQGFTKAFDIEIFALRSF